MIVTLLRSGIVQQLRRFLPQPPMWTFQQHSPKPLRVNSVRDLPALADPPPRIAIVTPSYNQRKYLEATVASVLGQNYPALSYHVQDGASQDGTVDLLNAYGGQVSWRSEPDSGQANAINAGFKTAAIDCDIMAYLNSDDTLLRRRCLGHAPTQRQIYQAAMPFLTLQLCYHWMYRLKILKY